MSLKVCCSQFNQLNMNTVKALVCLTVIYDANIRQKWVQNNFILKCLEVNRTLHERVRRRGRMNCRTKHQLKSEN